MDIGVGLPNAIQDVDADSLVEFAKKADARGFSSLGTVDRIVDEAWERAGRSGKPRKASLAYYSLGLDAQAHAERNIGHYYAWLGDYAAQIVGSTATSPEMVKSYVDGFEQAGCDELVLFPASKHFEQADLLADAVGK